MLLRRLAVFAGGWTLEAAEQACASDALDSYQIFDVLLMLVDKCLVVPKTEGADPRYFMLETIRQYAQEKLDESGEASLLRDNHLEYFCSLAEQARPHFRDAQQFMWLDRFETELDNVRAALTWALQGGSVGAGLRLAATLGVDMGAFWVNRGHMKEGRELLEQLLPKSQDTVPIDTLAAGYFSVAVVEFWLGDMADAHRHAEQSESLWSQLGASYKVKAAEARILKTYISKELDPSSNLIEQFQENLSIFRESGDRWMQAYTLHGIAYELARSANLMDARKTYEQILALFQECGDSICVSKNKLALAIIALKQSKYAEARILCEEALAVIGQLPSALKDEPLWVLGAIASVEGNYADAKAWYTECLLFDQELGIQNQFAECLLGFASIASAEKHFERAAQLVGRAESVVTARQFPLEDFDQAELQRLRTVLREELGDVRFEVFAAEGRALTVEQAIAFALEQSDE